MLSKNCLKVCPKNELWRKTLQNSTFSAVNVQPFESIPGPPGRGWPFIGHMNEMFKNPAGFGKSWMNMKELRKKYLKEEDKLLRLHLPFFNYDNDGRFVLLLDPDDIKQVYRHEGKHPAR